MGCGKLYLLQMNYNKLIIEITNNKIKSDKEKIEILKNNLKIKLDPITKYKLESELNIIYHRLELRYEYLKVINL